MPNQNSEETDLLTVKEFAQALAIDETTVHKWIKAGLVETVALPRRAGGRTYHRIKRSTLHDILNSNPRRDLPRS